MTAASKGIKSYLWRSKTSIQEEEEMEREMEREREAEEDAMSSPLTSIKEMVANVSDRLNSIDLSGVFVWSQDEEPAQSENKQNPSKKK